MQLGWQTPRHDSLKLANHTRIQNAHKVSKKILIFYYVTVGIYVQLLGGLNRFGLV